MGDRLDGWGNSTFEVRDHVEVPTPGGVVTVERVPGDTDSQTRWTIPITTSRRLILRRRANLVGRLLRSGNWADHGDFSFQGDRELARSVAEDSRVGAVLRGWRSFELRVEQARVLLTVPTGNIDQREARQGVGLVVAVMDLIGP